MTTERTNGQRLARELLLGTAIGLALACMSVARAGDGPSMDDVEQAVLGERWEELADGLLASVTNDPSTSPSPVLRLIKGHACLALNRNNQSLALFASALNKPDHKAWYDWTAKLPKTRTAEAQSPPKTALAIAWYLTGDAHARRKEWKAAADCFDEAVKLVPQCYLALNARGVVAHAVGNTLMARLYFVRATKAKEDFADAYASRGTLGVYLHSGGSGRGNGPGEFFRRAKHSSQDRVPVLAAIGLGCAYFGSQQYEQARTCFSAVAADSDPLQLARYNLLKMQVDRLKEDLHVCSLTGMSLTSLRTMVDETASQPLNAPKLSETTKPGMRSTSDLFWALLIGISVGTAPFPEDWLPPDVGPVGPDKPTVETPIDGGKPPQGQGPPEDEDEDTSSSRQLRSPNLFVAPAQRLQGLLGISQSASDPSENAVPGGDRRGTSIVIGGMPGPNGWPPIYIEPPDSGVLTSVISRIERETATRTIEPSRLLASSANEHPIDEDDVIDVVPVRDENGRIISYVLYLKDGSVWVYYPKEKRWRKVKGPNGNGESTPGGVDTDMSLLRRIEGGLGVYNLYGLLYAVHANSP